MGFMTRTSGDMVLTSCFPDVLCISPPNREGLGRCLEGSASASGSRPLLTAAQALLVCVAASDNCSFTSSLIPSKEPEKRSVTNKKRSMTVFSAQNQLHYWETNFSKQEKNKQKLSKTILINETGTFRFLSRQNKQYTINNGRTWSRGPN